MPDISLEDAARGDGHAVIAGIDEARRGPWWRGAVIIDSETLPADLRHGHDDFKKLKPAFSLAAFPTSQPHRDLKLLDRLMGQLTTAGLE